MVAVAADPAKPDAVTTPEALAFLVRHTSGIICTALPGERLDALELPLMVRHNTLLVT